MRIYVYQCCSVAGNSRPSRTGLFPNHAMDRIKVAKAMCGPQAAACLPLTKTPASKQSDSRPGRFTAQEKIPATTRQETGRAPKSVWRCRKEENPAVTRIKPLLSSPLPSHHTEIKSGMIRTSIN